MGKISGICFLTFYDQTKCPVEGSLFIYTRDIEPSFGFTILNRISPEDFSAYLTPTTNLELTADYIMFNVDESKGAAENRLFNDYVEVYGIWFFQADDMKRASSILTE